MIEQRELWAYDSWPSVEPTDWSPAFRGDRVDDQIDFHVDLGCGTVKKGRIGIDRFPAPGVNVVMDLNELVGYAVCQRPGEDAVECPAPFHGLPFADSQIESIVTHHCLEHIGEGFVALIDECWRVLKPNGLLRVIVPLFPSTSAVEDPDHKRYFMENSFASFWGGPSGECWMSSFSVPYARGRFVEPPEHKECSPMLPPEKRWTDEDRREMRLSLRAVKQ